MVIACTPFLVNSFHSLAELKSLNEFKEGELNVEMATDFAVKFISNLAERWQKMKDVKQKQ